MKPTIVETTDALRDLCDELGASKSFALDTEFVRERTFYIQLGIVQVATDDSRGGH